MNSIKKVLICGLGAIGSIYAVKIAPKSDIELKVLVDSVRFEKYKTSSLVFNGVSYNFDYVLPSRTDFVADLIIIATKNNVLDEVIENLKNFVGPETIILSLLNGLKSEDILSGVFGKEKVLYSYYIGHTSTRIGRNVVHDDVYKTVFGEKDNLKYSENVLKVKEFFDSTKINYEIPVDMDYSRWWKFLVNVGYNQASAILNASYGVFQNSKKANNFAIKLMEEAVELANLSGVKNTQQLIPEVLDVIKTMLPDTRTSMLQDIDAKRQTEVDIFSGYICELGQKYNISVPYNKIAYEIIKAIDDKNMMD